MQLTVTRYPAKLSKQTIVMCKWQTDQLFAVLSFNQCKGTQLSRLFKSIFFVIFLKVCLLAAVMLWLNSDLDLP